MTGTPDQGLLLLELQKTDTSIARATKRLEGLPEKDAILQTRQKRGEVQALRGKAEKVRASLAQKLSAAEDEAAMLDTKIAEEQAKLMSGDITNPKEVQNISREMDSLKRRKDKLEMESLDLMERVEKATAQLKKVDDALTTLDEREQTQVAEYKRVGADVQTEISEANRRRTTIVGALDSELRERYAKMRESKGIIVVGALEGSTCTACRMELPSQRIAELKNGPSIAVCPACHRLLIVGTAASDA